MHVRSRVAAILAVLLALAGAVTPRSAEALDVYTTPGKHTVNGRQWNTSCSAYSSTVERCRTEIWATTITYSGGRFTQSNGWAFNNLTYKPSPRANWAGNILAIPGEHVKDGRRWKTECDTAWTGVGACRSSILATVYKRSGGGFTQSQEWVFNNIVRFSTSAKPVPFCEPTQASAGISSLRTQESPSDDGSPAPQASPAAEPEPGPGTTPSDSPDAVESASPEPSAVPTDNASPEPSTSPSTDAGTTRPTARAVAPAADAVTIAKAEHPDLPGGALYDRFGGIRVTGAAPDGETVSVELRDAAGKVRGKGSAVSADGKFQVTVAGGFAGKATLRASTATGSASRSVELKRATVSQKIATRIDPLANATLSGKLAPAVINSLVTAYVRTPSGWAKAGEARMQGDGSYSIPWGYGKASLGTFEVRACVTLPWGATVPSAASSSVERARIANPVITNTTAAEVASTYRSGCPVAPSNLSTLRINQQSMDGHVYRGEIVVRRDRAADVSYAFTRAFEAGFPVYSMVNPNAFNGSDIASMAANNTSAFNCRKVVGNPYAISPHSYGYAVDLNPLQNPYRDPQGKWHPSTKYVERTPVVPGMLTKSSAPVVAFTSRGWSWFSGWDWHHFEKR